MTKSALDNFSAAVRTPELRPFVRFFGRNLERAENLRWQHVKIIFEDVLAEFRLKTMTDVISARTVKPIFAAGGGRFSDEFMAEVNRRMSRVDDGHPENVLLEGAEKRIEKLKQKDATFVTWFRTLEQSSTVAIWSAFETLVCDAWIFAVNSRPDLFAIRVLQGFNEILPEGMSGRSIPVGIAAKYNFDLRHCIGDIIGRRIDFTSLQEIRKAYQTAFGLDDQGIALLTSADLKRLVLIRNLVVHRSGLVDLKFKEQTQCREQVGDELDIAEEETRLFITVVTDVGTHLMRTVDDCLTPSS